MERFGQEKEGWLRGFLELPGGVPSHDTFRAVLSALAAKQLAHTLIGWTEGVRQTLGSEIVAIDGKSARRSGSSARAALHLAFDWAPWAAMAGFTVMAAVMSWRFGEVRRSGSF